MTTRPAARGWLGPYFAAWLPPAALLVALLAGATSLSWGRAAALGLPLALLLAQLCLTAAYLTRAFPLAPAGGRLARSLVAVTMAAVVTCALWVALGRLWAGALAALAAGFYDLPARYLEAVPPLYAAGVLLYLLAAAGHYLAASLAASRQAERRALEAQVLAREAELRALRAQIDPHFLFNSLNALAALAGGDPPAARRVALLLAGFLRRSLRLGERAAVPLGEELEAARAYLAIEQVRFGERLRVEERIDPEVEALAVPPLILQPLVENAIKHGIAGRVDGGTVTLEAARDSGGLRLAVINDRDPEAPAGGGEGIGLANVRRRLDAAYGRRARLSAAPFDGGFRAEVALPAEEAAPAPGAAQAGAGLADPDRGPAADGFGRRPAAGAGRGPGGGR